jgi:hypothetical protein
VVLVPRAAPRQPALVSDGSGLPFAPAALSAPAPPLDGEDPAVAVLLATIARQAKPARPSRVPWRRGSAPSAPVPPSLDGWRVAARTDDEVLFARGRPPRLVTVAVRRDPKRRGWTCIAVSAGRPLRSTRDGIRASGWRLDPTGEPDAGRHELRVLITEQTWAGGMGAEDRLLAPDLHLGDDELVLTVFVTPRPGFQVRSRNPETPARVALPTPVGRRRVLDGAVYEASGVQSL